MKETMIDLNLEKMSFSEAVQNLIEGNKVRRKSWAKGDYTKIDLTQGCFVNYFADINDHISDFTLSFIGVSDILAIDWEVIK